MLATNKLARLSTLIFYIYCYKACRNQALLVYIKLINYSEIISSALAINLIITMLLAIYLYLRRKRYLKRVKNV
jgi:hypothetical protein